jgi:RNA polymerase sigma factor (sigma-70 family)
MHVHLNSTRMSSQGSPPEGERLQVLRSQQGDAEALAALRQKHDPVLVNILLARGASRTETEDLLADLWTDCVPGSDDRPSLLEKFSGKCSLQGWLATVATNRWIDKKRRDSRKVDISASGSGEEEEDAFERLPGETNAFREDATVELLRESLRKAFARCPAEAMVLLRLVYLHGVTQREVVRMLGWSEAKVSRLLSHAMEQIERDTLGEIKKRDAWLELSWQDFLDMCQTHQIGFL